MNGEKVYNVFTSIDIQDEKKLIQEENSKIRIKKNGNNFEITIQENQASQNIPLKFQYYFYNEIRKNFDFLKVKYENEEVKLINKKEILKKLNNKKYEYFTKYLKNVKEVNEIIRQVIIGIEKNDSIEAELEENIISYLFKIDEIKDIGNKTIESKTPEIYSGYNIPTLKTYVTKKVHRKKIKINFEEKLDESKSSPERIKSAFKQMMKVPETEPFEFDFIIKGYYIYNTETETVEKIEVDKEIKFYNVTTSTKRVLELEGFDENEKDEGKTYDEAVGELFEYLDKMGRKKEIDRQEFENFVDGIAFSEKPKIFETLKWSIETNKIGFLELIEGERDRIYISEKEVLKVFEEIFDV